MSSQSSQEKTILLGDEYDVAVRDALVSVLKELGGHPRSSNWDVGGSQEIERMEVDIADSVVLIESETYVGISISGSGEIVERISDLVKARLNRE